MGKYDKVLGGLPITTNTEERYQVKVETAKDAVRRGAGLELTVDCDIIESTEPGVRISHTAESLGRLYVECRAQLEVLESARFKVQTRTTALEQMLTVSCDASEPGWGTHGAKPHTMKFANGDAIDVLAELTVKVLDREAARLWCKAQGMEKDMHLHPSTLSSIAKQRRLAFADPIDGTELSMYQKVKYRPARPASGDPGDNE